MNCTKMFQNLNKFIYSKYIFIKTIKKFVPSFPLTVIISEKKKKNTDQPGIHTRIYYASLKV